MPIDLLGLEPHQVSRDLSGYFTYIYGPPKSGKTTLASQMPKPILLAFERGYNAIPGIIAQDITSWSEMKQVLRELKKPAVQEKFSTVVIDTVDLAAVACDKFVCSTNGVNSIGEIPYGQGWNLLKREFEDTFKTIAQLGYAIVFISHAKEGTFKRQDGTEYTQITPSVANTYNSIIENMVDIYGYLHPVFIDGTSKVVITLRSFDGTVRAGGRFKYITPEIEASYSNLSKALNDAIDKEAAEHDNQFVTNEKNITPVKRELDFDALVNDFNTMINNLLNSCDQAQFESFWQPRITEITNKYLGRGKKVNQCTRDQVEMLELINIELADAIAKANQ